MGQPETATSSHQYLGEKGVSKIANKGNSQTKHTILGKDRGKKGLATLSLDRKCRQKTFNREWFR